MIGELISVSPELMTWFGDLFLKNTDWPGHIEMSERAKVMLAPQIQQFLAQQESQQAPIPAPIQAKLQEQQQIIEQANQVIQQLAEEAQGKRLDYQAKVEIEQFRQQGETEREAIKAKLQIELQAMKGSASLGVAHIAAEAKGVQSEHVAIDEAIARGQEHAFTAQQAERDRQLAVSQMAHDAAQADADADRMPPEPMI